MAEPPASPSVDEIEDELDEEGGELLGGRIDRKHLFWGALFVVVVVAFLYIGLPRLAGLNDTWDRIQQGSPTWLLACLVFEVVSFGGYVWLFRGVFVRGSDRIGWAASYQITMAGLLATRLFSAGGAGGAALTVWALRRSGMRTRLVATRMVAQYVILYGIYMVSVIVFGLGLYFGLFPGGGDFAITLIPAGIGAVLIGGALAMTLIPDQIDRRVAEWMKGSGRVARIATRLAALPDAVAAGVREALTILRERDGAVLGAVIWWYFDILTLWAAFKAFGDAPPFSVIVMAYFVGMVANLLPLPGGIGGVDGGLIGAFIAFGVEGSLAIVAVLTYRAFAFWLPTIPGVIAYFQLRRTVGRWKEEGRDARAVGEAPVPAKATLHYTK
ncbi:MAG: YbhN family protein [Solirubrobacterales bacterium]